MPRSDDVTEFERRFIRFRAVQDVAVAELCKYTGEDAKQATGPGTPIFMTALRIARTVLREPADPPPIDPVEADCDSRTYHVGGLLCDQGQSPGGVLSITARRRPYLDDAAIIVGSPSATPMTDAPDRLPKIEGWAMSTATARRLVATLQQAILDVEVGTPKKVG